MTSVNLNIQRGIAFGFRVTRILAGQLVNLFPGEKLQNTGVPIPLRKAERGKSFDKYPNGTRENGSAPGLVKH